MQVAGHHSAWTVVYRDRREFVIHCQLRPDEGFLTYECAHDRAPGIQTPLVVRVGFQDESIPGLERFELQGQVVKVVERMTRRDPQVVLRVEGHDRIRLQALLDFACSTRDDPARLAGPRVPVEVPVKHVIDGQTQRAALADLSFRGAQVVAQAAPPSGPHDLQVRVGLWRWEPVRGRIAWTATEEARVRFGLEFASLSEGGKRWLVRMLQASRRP
jgi:hypothetical protein